MKIKYEKDIARWCVYLNDDYIGEITREDKGWCVCINGCTKYADNFHDAKWYARNM